MNNLSKWAAIAAAATTDSVNAWPTVWNLPDNRDNSGSPADIIPIVTGLLALLGGGILLWRYARRSSSDNNTNDRNDEATPLNNMNNAV